VTANVVTSGPVGVLRFTPWSRNEMKSSIFVLDITGNDIKVE